MEWVSDLLGVGASALSGGVFGLIGAGLKIFSTHMEEKRRQAWQVKKWDRTERLMKLNMEKSDRETENELSIVSQQGAWSGLNSSINADASMNKNAPAWAIAVCKVYRPVLTTGLIVIVYMMWRDLVAETGISKLLEPAQRFELILYILHTTVFTASAAAVWWFGERAVTPPGLKHR